MSVVDSLKTLGQSLSGDVVILDPQTRIPAWNDLQSEKSLASPLVSGAASQPTAVAMCNSKQDVVKCMEFGVAHNMRVQPRGNGHHYAAIFKAEGGLVIDVSKLKGISIDSEKLGAVVEPGVITSELSAATIKHGLHFPGGHISNVGISGFTLGGGNGWGVRHCGAACDNITAMEVVLPTKEGCKLTLVTQESDPELFWGLCGAGAFLGVVTEFHFKLRPVPNMLPFIDIQFPVEHTVQFPVEHTVQFPLDYTEQVCEFWHELLHAETTPITVEPAVAIFTHPVTKQQVISLGSTAFEDTDAVHQCFEKIRAFMPDKRSAKTDEKVPYLKALSSVDVAWNWPGLCLFNHSAFVPYKDCGNEFYKVMVLFAGRSACIHSAFVPYKDYGIEVYKGRAGDSVYGSALSHSAFVPYKVSASDSQVVDLFAAHCALSHSAFVPYKALDLFAVRCACIHSAFVPYKDCGNAFYKVVGLFAGRCACIQSAFVPCKDCGNAFYKTIQERAECAASPTSLILLCPGAPPPVDGSPPPPLGFSSTTIPSGSVLSVPSFALLPPPSSSSALGGPLLLIAHRPPPLGLSSTIMLPLHPLNMQTIRERAECVASPTSLILLCPGAPPPVDGSPTPAFGFREHAYMSFYAMWARTEAGPEQDGDLANANWVKGSRKALNGIYAGSYINEVVLCEVVVVVAVVVMGFYHTMWARTGGGPAEYGDLANAEWMKGSRKALNGIYAGSYINEVSGLIV
eukprot:gene12291-15447_t